MEKIIEFLNTLIVNGENVKITVGTLLALIGLIVLTHFVLNIIRKYMTRKLNEEDKMKFVSFYDYIKYFIYVLIIVSVLNSTGVKITGLLAGAAALMVGVGLALQTFFQDIISGVFILIDQSVHVNDIIEVDGKVGRVTQISLRTTKAITIDNRILIIPNHLYLTNTLYNWTQNDTITRETVTIGVAYGSDVQLVKKLLITAAKNIPEVLPKPEPLVLFNDFGDSALVFKLVVTIEDSFNASPIKSNLRFEIDRLFRENNISIPFPQRDIHIINK
jgi:small-conductance mechanosensitive channel